MAKITDILLDPYYIGRDSHCYTVYEVVTPQEKYLEKGSEGKVYEKPVSHHSNFSSALVRVAREKMHSEKDHYDSINEYIERWNVLNEQLKKFKQQTL
jgi:hypothetical protein